MKIERIIQGLNERLAQTEKIIDHVDSSIGKMPPGRLRIQRQGKSVEYYCAAETEGDKDHNGRKISDRDLIRSLAEKSYLISVRRAAAAEYRQIKHLIDHYPDKHPEDIYHELSQDRKSLVTPMAVNDEEYAARWLAQPYVKKPFEEGAPNFMTLKGDRVRSKSEQIIADRLYVNKIPYKYECPIMVGNKKFHPDFTVLKVREREVVYWEHCGAMDRKGYSDYAVDRFNRYAGEGILIGKNMIATFETADVPLDVEAVDRLIDAHFK